MELLSEDNIQMWKNGEKLLQSCSTIINNHGLKKKDKFDFKIFSPLGFICTK